MNKIKTFTWLKTLKYILFPISIVSNFATIISLIIIIVQESNYDYTSQYTLILIINIALFLYALFCFLFLIKNMKNTRIYIIMLFIINYFIFSLSRGMHLAETEVGIFLYFCTFFIIMNLVWTLPNYIYLKNRDYLFTNEKFFNKSEQKLKKLKKLYENNLITEGEYNQKKKQIIDSI